MVELNANNFEKEVLQAKETVIVLFHMDRCPYCQAFMPIYDAATGFRFEKAEISDYDSPLWEQYVPNDTVPTVVAFNSGKQIARLEGKPRAGLTKQEFDGLLTKLSTALQ